MRDFKLINNDIAVQNKDVVVLDNYPEAVRQSLQTKLRTFRGEWILDTTYGIDYFGSVLGKATKQEVDALYTSEILSHPDVTKINRFVSTYNPYTRFYDVDIDIDTRKGSFTTFIASVRPDEEITYPDGSTQALVSSCV